MAGSRGHVSTMEHPVSGSIFQIILLGIVFVLVFYFIFILRLSVVSGGDLRSAAIRNASLSYIVSPPRGTIFDRNGQTLAFNLPNFKLLLISRHASIKSLENGAGLRIAQILDISEAEVEADFNRISRESVVEIKKDISKEQAVQLGQLDIPGLVVVSEPERVYPHGSYFSHIIGYINNVSEKDLNRDSYYYLRDKIGRTGIEATYEAILRGEHGVINFSQEHVDPQKIVEEESGNSLVLNIDSTIQQDLFDSLEKALRSAGLHRGAAVIQNPNSGAVLGLVSFPTYDNNELQDSLTQDQVTRLFQDSNRPLFNRAIGGLYSPGSTIKPLYALAGLNEKTITPQTSITDLVGFITIPNQFDPNIVYTYRDWKIQGTVDLRKAIAQSSDIFFYSVGGGYGNIKGLGIDRITKYLRDFLADKALGIDLAGEQSGFVPDPTWKLATKGEPWFTGDTYNISIGQGDLLVTPLWLSTYTAAIANEGIIYRPEVVNKIVNKENETLELFEKEIIGQVDFDLADLRAVQEGMRQTATTGTSRLLANLPVPVAAKSGTAEVLKGKSSNSLITVYGPYQDPNFVLSVVIEGINQNQQGLATQVAYDFLTKYFAKNL